MDINSVDHTISQNYIHGCDIGVQIGNGGVRVINNDIFGNATAAVQIEQTANNVIIAANDLNANARNGIIVTRTTVLNAGPWSQVMIANNSIQGDALAADNSHDAIYVTTSVPKGIQEITIVGNKIYSPFAGKRFRYGVNLAENVVRAKCAANHILDAATAPYNVGPGCSGVDIDRLGAGALKPPGVPRSGRALRNPFPAPVMVYVFGGKVKSIAVDNLPTGLTGGSLRLLPDQTITLAYTQAPRWTWFSG